MYERYMPQKAPVMKPEHYAILAGSLALVVLVTVAKNRKKRRKK